MAKCNKEVKRAKLATQVTRAANKMKHSLDHLERIEAQLAEVKQTGGDPAPLLWKRKDILRRLSGPRKQHASLSKRLAQMS